jgi:predicted flap endonuclease-1-like 5' DNA nuclease
MFEQNPVLGPGTGTATTHTLEILLMLTGAFLLGLWLGWLLWNRFKAMYDQLLAEHESVKLSLEAANLEADGCKKRSAQLEADTLTLRGRIDSISSDYHDSEARLQGLNAQISSLNAAKTVETVVEMPNVAPEIELEIIESPVDVHVESLVEEVIPEPIPEMLVEEIVPEIEVVEESPAIEIEEITPEIVVETPTPVFVAPIISKPVEIRVAQKTERVGEPLTIRRTETVIKQSETVFEPIAKPAPIVETVFEPIPETTVESTPEPETVVEQMVAAPVFVPATSADNLQIVEGIGPKIEQVLNTSGILTFRQLASSNETQLREILLAAGSRYRLHDPSTWPAQSKMADDGEWENLKKWQDELKSGRGEAFSSSEISEEQAEIVKIAPETVAVSEQIVATSEPIIADDLKIVEGIGPKIQELLVKNGISTFLQLSATPVAALKEILESAGNRYAIHDPGTWPAQALLASNGEWDNLKSYQGFLNAGKRPE